MGYKPSVGFTTYYVTGKPQRLLTKCLQSNIFWRTALICFDLCSNPVWCTNWTLLWSIYQTSKSSKGPGRDGTIGEDTIRASLISAVSDKLRWRMKEEMDRAQAELDALKRTEEDLKKGHQKLEEMVSRLDQEVVRDPSVIIRFACFTVLSC